MSWVLQVKTEYMIRGYIKRDRKGKFTQNRKRVERNEKSERRLKVMALGVLLGILAGISLDVGTREHVIVKEVKAEEVVVDLPEPLKEVQIEVIYNWDKDKIISEIEKAFPEDPKTAVAIAKCESGFKVDIQSHHIGKDGKQERSFSLFQIHEPSWDKVATRLGFEDYKTSPRDNIDMARYIYVQSGKKWTAWSCYTKRMI